MSLFQPKIEQLETCSNEIVATLPEEQRKHLEAVMGNVADRWQKLQDKTSRRQNVLEKASELKASFDRTLGEMNDSMQQLEAACVSPIPWQEPKLVQKDLNNKEVRISHHC